jgi:hypothetical protein
MERRGIAQTWELYFSRDGMISFGVKYANDLVEICIRGEDKIR